MPPMFCDPLMLAACEVKKVRSESPGVLENPNRCTTISKIVHPLAVLNRVYDAQICVDSQDAEILDERNVMSCGYGIIE